MKEGWTYKKLGEVCETLNGLWKGKKPPFVNVGVIRNANFTKDFTLRYDNVEYLDVEEKQYVKRKLQRGDLIIEKSGGSEKQPVGRAVLFDKENGEFSFSNFTSVLRVKNDILQSRFLYIYLLFIYKRGDTLKMQKATTGIHNIEFDKYLNIDIPILPLSQQQRIVSRLDAAFAHIDALKANAEKQLAEARQLFQAELAECMRPKEGWEEKTLKSICKINSGKSIKADLIAPVTSNDVLVPCYGGNGLRGYVSEANCAGLNPIIGRVGAQCGNIHYSQEPFYATEHALVVTLLDDGVNPLWLCRQLEYMDLKQYAEGAAQPVIAAGRLLGLIIAMPTRIEQQKIVSRLDALSANVKKLEEVQRKTLAECDALKQAMLREVFD